MLRAALENPKVTVVAVNDPFIDLDYMVSEKYSREKLISIFCSGFGVLCSHYADNSISGSEHA